MKTPYIFPLCLITGQYLSTVVLAGGGSLPSFIKPPGDQTGVYGGVASFVCQAEGEPRPQVTWTKRGKAVSLQRFEVIEFDAGSGSVLRIQPLRTPRDEAIYDCTATNSVGTITTSAKLTVLEEDKIPQGFPTIDMGPHLKVVERMRTATMICAASGQPDPEISWFKDFLPVNINGSNGRIKQLDSGALQIEESEESDQGKYECVAMNSAGTRYSAPANLYVRVRRVPPRFAVLPTHQAVMPGSNVNLPCVAVGSPMPHVKWTAGGVDLTKEDGMPVGRNVLELTNILQSANYTCVAMSSLGVIETTAHITVEGQYLSTVVLAGRGSLPSFIKPPGDQTGVYGGVASFVCQAEGEPRPQVTWTKRGKAASHQRFEVIEFDAGSGSVLRIQPLRTPRDEAIYDCTATNSVGTITTSAKLTVLEEDKIPQGFPTIVMGPHLKVVERMRTATMICAASGQPDPEISWFKDFLPVNINGSNGRIKQLDSGALQIKESEESDQGKYECVAMNSAGMRYSAPANLYVRVRRVPPRFAILPTHQAVMPGSNVNLPCVAVGSPMPHVKWTAGGVDLTKEDGMPVGRNVLELTNILQSANYTCVAMSPLGVIETTAHITVEGQYLSTVVLAGRGSLPSFIKPPGDQTGVYGGVASFVCQAEGEPRPQVTWTKRGKAASHQRFEVIEFDAGSGSVLRIQPLRTPRDEAIYDCTATNSVGTITTSAKLTVLEEDKIPQGFPTIDMGPHLKVVERMRTATMICAASGQPDPEISWFKDFLPVNINGSNGRIKQLDSGALQIKESEESDQGKYECVAMNSAGMRYSAPANLYVRVRRVPPHFAILPTHQAVMPGSNVNLPCVAVGSPMPHVKWTAGGVDLTKEDETPVGRNVLELTNILQSANYTCVAMSPLGVIETTAHITVEDVDECEVKPAVCGPRGTCTNTPGSYTCSCQQGFRNHGNNRGPCEDVNECMESPPDCGPHGSYTCSCPEGFRNHGNNSTGPCEDVNECVESPPDCGPRGTCRNTPGSYVCSCPEGLRNHGNNSTGPCEGIKD